ncbi:MAG: helix-turn-helix transcriptional regulator [Polyangiales bacterium]
MKYGEPHRVLRAEERASWGVGFCAPCFAPTELVELFDPFERARAGASPVVTLPPDVRSRFEANCRLLAEETQGQAALHKPMVVKSLLAILLAEVSRAHTVSASAGLQPTLVGDALRFIERNCLRPLSLSEVAAELNKSTSYVASAVKRATGKTVGEWILVGRLSEARNRLLHSDEIVDVIAERVGYADSTHFIRLFRRVHGVTPAVWREQRQHAQAQL